ncbi:MalY/PatB family protein [Lapidilactobacillus mulanensis]|uniref:cysteine-S-conjugate beta-lyase n=1 Tax=Lapidilactobacillus mulanensis TaxID=2485999 RepID=A0ABW4DPS3_9LACO|nr:MalY/PatB family protein [Lapidilactobacillus mulanensis]
MYDFKTVIDRRHTNSLKWDVGADELPMWVADMDFQTAPEIIEALQKKATFGIFGYEEPDEAYFESVANWYQQQHGFRPEPDWMIFSNGVVPAISSIIRRLTNAGDNIVVQAPVYDIFYHSIENNGRHTLSNDLVYDEKALTYQIDFADLEVKLAEPLTSLMILCNPHNPIGHVWSREDLVRVAQLCLNNHVILLSDEIHGDLTAAGHDYTPIFSLPAALRANTIACVSPSKTFNVAALHTSTVIVPDENLRNSVSRGLNNDEIAEPNSFALVAAKAAYNQGAPWLAALKQQLARNRKIVAEFLATELPELKLVPAEATYLLWLECTDFCQDSAKLAEYIRWETGLYLSEEAVYRGNGADFLRLNIACPERELQDGLHRLQRAIHQYEKESV